MSSQGLQFVTDVSHSHAPLCDHKLITLRLNGYIGKASSGGYWKLNNNLLEDKKFKESVAQLVKKIFNDKEMNPIQKWEFFKFKARQVAINRSKEIKKQNSNKMDSLMNALQPLISRHDLSEEELKTLNNLKKMLNKMYVNLAKGAPIRSRAKWLKDGEKNSTSSQIILPHFITIYIHLILIRSNVKHL